MRRSPLIIATLGAAAVTLGGCAHHTPRYSDADFEPVEVPMEEQGEERVTGAIFDPSDRRGLFEDAKALRVGDILTVQLQERTNASKSVSASTSKDSEIGFGTPTVFNEPVEWANVSAGGSSSFDGEGEAEQENQLSGSLSVMITRVMPNGNLEIRGQKRLTLNRGTEYVRLSGIIRPQDITPDNTIASTKVANANIIYSGGGALHESAQMGWLSRFFNSPLWPL